MKNDVYSVRAAFMAQMLEDVDGLVSRLEEVDSSLEAKMKKSTASAIDQAADVLQDGFKRMMAQEGSNLKGTAWDITRRIDEQVGKRGDLLLLAVAKLDSHAAWYFGVFFAIATFAGAVGGFVGAWAAIR